MVKTIAFRGNEKGDFPYYIAKSLASNKFKVAVIDNSFSKDLFESIHQYREDGKNIIEKENMVYLKDALVSDEFMDKFDYVIFYMGLNDKTLTTQYSFILPDYSNTSIQQVKQFDEDVLADSYYIMRDKVTKKVTEKAIAKELNVNSSQILGYLPLDLKDQIAYMNFNYSGRQRIKELSSDMQLAIMTVVAMITGDNIKTVKKYYKKAKRNKKF